MRVKSLRKGGPSRWDDEDKFLQINHPELGEQFYDGHGRVRISRLQNFDERLNQLLVALAERKIEINRLVQRVEDLEERKGEPWVRKPGGLKKAPGPSSGRRKSKASS